MIVPNSDRTIPNDRGGTIPNDRGYRLFAGGGTIPNDRG